MRIQNIKSDMHDLHALGSIKIVDNLKINYLDQNFFIVSIESLVSTFILMKLCLIGFFLFITSLKRK